MTRSARPPERAAWTAFALLGLLAAARAVLAFVPGTAWWGLHLMRFAPAVPAWTLWAAGALALVPALALRREERLPRFVRDAEPGARAGALWAAAAAALAFALPDRTLFVGDSILRQNALNAPPDFAALNPQALPADGWLHDALPRALMARLHVDAFTATRSMGACEAAAMAMLSLLAARALDLKGMRAWAAASLVLFAGAFGLFTGYDKSLSELSLVAAAVAAFGLLYLRTGRGLAAMGIACALGVSLHRLGLGLLAAFVIVLALRPPGLAGMNARERSATLAGVLAPLLALALAGPALMRIVLQFDPQNFRGAGGGAADALAAAFTPRRLLDSANMLLWVAPLAPLAVVGAALARTGAARREGVFLASLVLPWLALLALFQPPIGMVRNWDVFAPLGVTVAFACAWTVSMIPPAGRLGRSLALAVVLNAFAPAAVALMHHANVDSGLARVEALLAESPQRDAVERASAWDFLGFRYVDVGRLDDSARAFGEAAALTPSPRILRQWAKLEEMRGRLAESRDVLRQLVRRKPDEVRAWMDLVRLSYTMGDTAGARAGAQEALRQVPGAEGPKRFLEWLGHKSISRP